MRFFGLLVSIVVLRDARAFSSATSGKFGRCYSLQPVSNNMAHNYVKKLEAEAVSKGLPAFVAKEMSQARELFKRDVFVSFVQDEDCVEPDYVVVYRKKGSRPTVYTVDALLVNCDKDVRVSVRDVERMLRVFCEGNNGHLQLYPLKEWSGGRYANVMMLEKSVS